MSQTRINQHVQVGVSHLVGVARDLVDESRQLGRRRRVVIPGGA